MSDVLGVRLPPNAGPWGVGAGRLGSRLRFRSTGRAWERKGSSGGSSSHLLAQPERHWALPSGWEICRWGPPRWGALRGSRLEAWLSSPTKVLRKERNAKCFPQEGCKKGGEWAAQRGIQGAVPSILLPARAVPHWRNWSPVIHCTLQSHSLSPSTMLTMGVLGSPSNCRGGHRKGSAEPPAVLELGKVQFLASWTGGGGPGSSQGSMW